MCQSWLSGCSGLPVMLRARVLHEVPEWHGGGGTVVAQLCETPTTAFLLVGSLVWNWTLGWLAKSGPPSCLTALRAMCHSLRRVHGHARRSVSEEELSWEGSSPAVGTVCWGLCSCFCLWRQNNLGYSWGLGSLNWALVKEDWIWKTFFWENILTGWPSEGENVYCVYAFMCVFMGGRKVRGGRDRGRRENVWGV